MGGVIATVSEKDDHWKALAKDQLDVSEEVFRDYLANGDSVLLANLIHITRPLFRLCLKDISQMADDLTKVLSRVSEFDIENTLPGLQHDFCDLWNEITREAHDRGAYDISYFILEPMLPSSYPSCNIPGHRCETPTPF
jgi:hypothetical protein